MITSNLTILNYFVNLRLISVTGIILKGQKNSMKSNLKHFWQNVDSLRKDNNYIPLTMFYESVCGESSHVIVDLFTK